MSLRQNDLQQGVVLREAGSERVFCLQYLGHQHNNKVPGWSWEDTSGTKGWTMVPTLLSGKFSIVPFEEAKRLFNTLGSETT